MSSIEFLTPIIVFLGAVTTLLKLIIEILRIVPPGILKKCLKYLAMIATQIAPIGMVIWYFMYKAAENSNRLTELVVFLLLIAESTILISLYEVIWGVWFLPKLKPVERDPSNNPPTPLVRSTKRRQSAKAKNESTK